jgi:tRNA threonylcarbamoyladenosine biosynthesis protein TsaE
LPELLSQIVKPTVIRAITLAMNTNLSQIPELAKKLSLKLKGGEIFGLMGPLGSGKTTFAKALAKELKIKHRVTSPTFTIMNRYEGRLLKTKAPIFLYHLDLYRTNSFKEVKALGITEIWGSKNCVILIEWANKIKKQLPKNTTIINFKNNEKSSSKI